MVKESGEKLASSPLFAKKNKSSILGTVIRTLLLDSPVFLVFCVYMSLLWIHHVHDNYLIPEMEAAAWEEDRDDQELTYYYRECDETDMSTTNAADLLLPENATPEEAYQHNLRHGFSVFPRVLSEETATGLRNHIRARNHNLTDEDNIWLEEQQNRWSFPLGTEEPYVTQALMEVASNKLLKETMAKILGENPAMIEMTAITAAYGAKAQSWHQDGPTAPSRFARGYRAGYSVFIQLQNTTKAMGATGACPGLYMCSEVPESVCDEHGLQPVNEHGYWRAGDALVMNMDSTHRGSAHTDPNAADRVMFIMTFVAKPRPRAESRQIIQGITFSLRWDMWGHTWQDLLHADMEMTQPWATLRSLGLYKKPHAVWGEDYVSGVVQRIAKEDFGFFREHLDDFVSFGGFKFIPQWLQGDVSENEDEGSWREFLTETMERCEGFMKGVAFQVAICYIVIFFSVSMAFGGPGMKGRLGRFGWALFRLGVIYGVAMALYNGAIKYVDDSDWAYDIRNGLRYTSPFGYNEEAVYDGPATMPNGDDVLVETRYKSEYLALYNDYIGQHQAGNRLWNELIDEKVEIYALYNGLPPVFRRAVAEYIVGAVYEDEGRFLYQSPDARWIVMSDKDSATQTEYELAVKSNYIKKNVIKELEYLISEVKYDHKRESAMSFYMLPYLLSLKTALATGAPDNNKKITQARKGHVKKSSSSLRRLGDSQSALPAFQSISEPSARRQPVKLHVGQLPSEPEDGAWLKVGDFVELMFRDESAAYWYKAELLDVLSTNVCLLHFTAEDYDEIVACTSLSTYTPPKVGDKVELYAEDEDGEMDFHPCRIVKDNGNGSYNVNLSGQVYEDINDGEFRRRRRNQ